MENLVCDSCWMAVGDMAKHKMEEHNVAPSASDLQRIERQRGEFNASLSVFDIEMVGNKKEFGGGHK